MSDIAKVFLGITAIGICLLLVGGELATWGWYALGIAALILVGIIVAGAVAAKDQTDKTTRLNSILLESGFQAHQSVVVDYWQTILAVNEDQGELAMFRLSGGSSVWSAHQLLGVEVFHDTQTTLQTSGGGSALDIGGFAVASGRAVTTAQTDWVGTTLRLMVDDIACPICEFAFPFPETAERWQGIIEVLRARSAQMGEGQATIVGKGISGQLTELHDLYQAGGLSEDEWDQAKVRFLGRPQAQVDAVADALTKLHSLKQAGVLSMSEFNSKKWDLLSKP